VATINLNDIDSEQRKQLGIRKPPRLSRVRVGPVKFTYSLWFGSVRFLDNDPKRPVQGEVSVDPSGAVLLETTEGGHGANHDGRLTR
jgi:hypothetical protein